MMKNIKEFGCKVQNKILFLTHEQVSHAHDTFFDGCLKLFGSENVFEYPCVPKYHSDYHVAHTYEWWCYNDLGHITSRSLIDWAKDINDGKIQYIVASNRGTGLENIKLLIPMIKEDVFSTITIIFLEEEEDPIYSVHKYCLDQLKDIYHKIDIHYKVDYLKHYNHNKKVKPFYMSAPINKIKELSGPNIPFLDKTIDVSYIVSGPHKNRIKIFEELQKLDIGNNIITMGYHQYGLTDYFKIINNSKIFISVKGNGWSNTRNVEGPIAGAALFTEEIAIEVPNDYLHKESAVFFNPSNIVKFIKEYLNDQNKLEELTYNSIKYCNENHTTLARAKQMVKLSKELKK